MRNRVSLFRKFKENFIGDRDFYKKVIMLAVPMILQNAVTSFVSFLDNIMVGQVGTEQMSGVAIVNQLIFVFNVAIFGGVSGAGIFGTQFFGKGDYEGQKHAFRFKMYACIFLGVAAVFLFHFADTQLISLYLSDSGSVGDIGLALQYGQEYLSVMIFGLIPFAIGQAYVNTIRETGQTFVPMVASMAAVVFNLFLDYSLIFGKFGAPVLGVKGAAYATVFARCVECLIVVIWTHMHSDKCLFIKGAYRNLGLPKSILVEILKKGTPLMLNELLWAAGMAAISQCYAVRGLEVVAANNISSTITNLFNIVYLQLGACIAIVVGQLLGAGKLKEAKLADNQMIFFSVMCCALMSIIMIICGRFFPEIYNTESSIKELANSFIVISATAMPSYAFSHCSYFTLRSGGKTIVTFLFDSVYTWVIVIPIATILAKHTTLPIVTVFFIVQYIEFVKAVIGYFMVKSNVWMQNIVTNA
jgi:putative MATE family efflux protein